MAPSPRLPRADVVTLGECMGVLYPPRPVAIENTPVLSLDIAGTEANTAIGLARLGIRARFISRVGNDPFGRRIRAVFRRESVDTRGLITDPAAPTGVFFREPLADGKRRVYYYRAGSAASRLSPRDLQPQLFHRAKVVHLSGITPALSASCARAVGRAVHLAKAAGALVSLDPNYRRPLWKPAAARRALLPLMRQVNILLLSHEDAEVLFGKVSTDAVLRRSAALGVKVAVLKRAEHGASALIDGVRMDVPASRVRRVVDTVGAGDGFNAGFLAGLVRGWPWSRCLSLGARIGARAVATLGDYAGYPLQRGR